MGCLPSCLRLRTATIITPISPNTPPVASIELKEITPEIDLTLKKKLPQVQITIGENVINNLHFNPIVIFIFGGPGSLKGILTQELTEEFEFITINVESIVFSYLPQKLANTVKNTVEMQKLIQRDKKVFNLKWLLQMISTKLNTSNRRRFVIDIVPESNSLLHSSAFSSIDDHNERLEEFDQRHQVLFALELYIDEKKVLSKKGLEPAVEPSNGLCNVISSNLGTFLHCESYDEINETRLERRVNLFRQYSEPFLEFFRKSNRVVRVDLKEPENDELLPSVRQVLVDLGFGQNNDSIQIVLFVWNKSDLINIDLEYYRLRIVNLKDVCGYTVLTMTQQIREIRKFIFRTAKPNENVVVNLRGLNETGFIGTKRINFIECHTTFLDHYIRNTLTREPKSRCKMAFRAIISTNEEICLFPVSIPDEICKKIGFVFGEKLSLNETDMPSSSQQSIDQASKIIYNITRSKLD